MNDTLEKSLLSMDLEFDLGDVLKCAWFDPECEAEAQWIMDGHCETDIPLCDQHREVMRECFRTGTVRCIKCKLYVEWSDISWRKL